MLDIDLMFELMAPNDSKSKIIFVKMQINYHQ